MEEILYPKNTGKSKGPKSVFFENIDDEKSQKQKMLADFDRVKNPITGQYGVKCTSVHMKEAWI